MRRKSLKPATTSCSRRRVGRRVTTHKVTRSELAIREEVRRAFMSIRGMHIDDVFPPSRQDPSLIPCQRPQPAKPVSSQSSRGGGRKMARTAGTAGARRTRPAPHDEDAIREELLQALMSIRGKHIEDVYPGSGDDEVHA